MQLKIAEESIEDYITSSNFRNKIVKFAYLLKIQPFSRIPIRRLSRKQLPAVDLNGNVRYSTPSGETEIEWLARGANGTPNGDTRQQRAFSATYQKIEERSGDNSSGEKANYWRTKPRELLRTPPEVSTTYSEDIDSDWSRESKVTFNVKRGRLTFCIVLYGAAPPPKLAIIVKY